MNRAPSRTFLDRLLDLAPQAIALVGALAVGAVVLALLGVNPANAYWSALVGVFGSKNGLSDMLAKATPLLLVALGICIAFRSNVINIGAEGQLVVGALAAAATAISIGERVGAVGVILAAILAGTLAGAIYGAIPGALKANLSVNEILSTVMLNQIAVQFGLYLLSGPMLDPAEVAAGTNVPHSARLPQAADLPRFTDVAKSLGFTQTARQLGMEGAGAELYGLLVEPTRLHVGFLLALVMAVLVYVLLWRTAFGYKLRAVGQNPHAARYAGYRVQLFIVLALTLSGAFAGLAGAIEVLGLHHRMFEPAAVSAGYGFTGIVVALFARLHPIAAIPSSLLFGALLVGGDKMQRAMQIPQPLVTALVGLIVLFVVSAEFWTRRRAAQTGIAAARQIEEPLPVADVLKTDQVEPA